MSKTKNTNDLSNDEFAQYIKSIDLNLIQIENVGASLLSIGYGLYISAGCTDTSELLNLIPDIESADDIFIIGQKLVLSGYFILYTVSLLRIEEKKLIIENGDDTLLLWPFITISQTYLASVFINYERLKAFIAIKIDNDIDEQNEADEDSGE